MAKRHRRRTVKRTVKRRRKVARKIVRRRKVVRRRRKVVPPKRRRRRVVRKPPKKRRPPKPPEDEEDDDDDDYGREWEFGFEYDARGQDSSHDVDVNFRIRHRSGQEFSRTDALRVMKEFAESGGKLPPGFQVSAVNWKHPRRSTKRWLVGERVLQIVTRGPLRAVLDAAGEQLEIWRLGNPK